MSSDSKASTVAASLASEVGQLPDDLLSRAKVILVGGPGGVGKTTVTAALGLRAAQDHGRRVVVITVDPARRLAEALGVSQLTEEPVLVPVGHESGRLWVLMVDMAKSWDELVRRHAPSEQVSQDLLANGLYRTLTRRFIQSHDYIALDHLCDLADDARYDLIVVDTPPSRHALDLLDAPGRMIEFFESRLLKWLISGAGSGLGIASAKPFLLLADRLLGKQFMAQIIEFFTLFSKLRPAFVARAGEVEQRLVDESTSYALVTTTEPGPIDECNQLLGALDERGLEPDLVVVNRLDPVMDMTMAADGTKTLTPRFGDTEVAAIGDRSLAQAMGEMLDRSKTAQLPDPPEGCPMVAVPWSHDDLTDLDGLARFWTGHRS